MAQPSFWSTVRFVAIAGVGLFADGYLNITIGLVVPMFGHLYYADPQHKGTVPTVSSDIIKGALPIGMVIGQLTFGLFGDALGRHKIYGKELLLTIFGTLMVVVVPTYFSQADLLAWMVVFRIITGLGTGGDYPMTSALSAENASVSSYSRSRLVLTVFSFIGLGVFTAAIVYVILLSAFHQAIVHDIQRLQWVWRLLLGLGLVPCLATVYARLTMRESQPYEKYVAHDTGLIGKDKRGLTEQFSDFRIYFSNWKHARTLFAVSASWLLFDIAFYGINLNQAVVLTKIGYGKGSTPYETLFHTAVGNVIVSVAGYLPGFYCAIPLADLIGRRTQQCLGSAIVAIIYAIWAGVTHVTSTGGLIALFTLSQFFLNVGPNATTFLLPVEVFPTRVRGTAHGIAAASGKVGAIVTAFAFGTITDRIGLNGVLGLFSGIMALVAVITLLIPETKGKSIEEIETGVFYGESLSAASSVQTGSMVEEVVFGDFGKSLDVDRK